MSKSNDRFDALYAIDLVKDLSDENAATLTGGIAVYTDRNYGGKARFAKGVPNLGESDRKEYVSFDDQISSIKNDTNVRWAFYTDDNYQGKRFTLEPGQSVSDLYGTGFNDKISSYRSEPMGVQASLYKPCY
jgi:hypothetical protein